MDIRVAIDKIRHDLKAIAYGVKALVDHCDKLEIELERKETEDGLDKS